MTSAITSDSFSAAARFSGVSPREPAVVRHDLDLDPHPIDAVPSLRAGIVGAGITGITAAILLPAKVPGIELVIYERNSDVGGVWHECTYPGVRCDVPSHIYQATFHPSREWTEHHAQGAEIQSYWKQIAEKHDAEKAIKLNHEILAAEWSEDKAKWVVTVRSPVNTHVDEVDFLIMATGAFSHPKLPNYPGLDEYEGHLSHSSRWDHNFVLNDKTIAIIGNGASGMQLLPQLHKRAARIDHYVRSGTWVAAPFGDNPEDRLSDELRSTFAEDPGAYLKYRKRIENKSFTGFANSVKGGEKSNELRENIIKGMKKRLRGRTDILEAIMPDFSPSCRRLTPGPGYLEALTEPNVEYITAHIERFTKTGIRTVDGKDRPCDAIVCCTGADMSFAPPFPLRSGSVDLSTAWRPGGSIGYPKTYLGIAAPGFPNLLFLNGPQAAAPTGTTNFSIENQVTAAARILRKAAGQGIRTMAPTAQATEDFQAFCDAYFPRTVQSDGCSSWFNGGVRGGRVLASWPGSGLHANSVRREPRWEDWEYTYRTKSGNRFAYFGNGWTQKDAMFMNQSFVDATPYLDVASVGGQLDLRDYHEKWYEV
ncbi:hypothetical protein BX600DRAFT_389195 [Xylariales sp. PMI_506]|nr:hypothetical protein BX600DRAFT_389195 [Xylariales sp. PMI_506]